MLFLASWSTRHLWSSRRGRTCPYSSWSVVGKTSRISSFELEYKHNDIYIRERQ